MAKGKEKYGTNAAENNDNTKKNSQQEELDREFNDLRNDIERLDREFAQKIDNLSTNEDLKNLREEIDTMNVSNEVKEKFIQLVKSVENLSKDERNDLLAQILSDKEDPIPQVADERFPSHALAFVRHLESSPLGQNILKDAAGIVAGTLDSAAALVKLGWTLIKDIFLLPRDVLIALKNNK